MAHFDERDGLSRAAAALRLALIIFPIMDLVMSVIGTAGVLTELKASRHHSGSFLFFHAALYPLTYLAIGLWAANMLKPIKGLHLKPVKWTLIFFALTLPIATLYYSHTNIWNWVLHIRIIGAVIRLMTFISGWFGALSLATICVFIAYKIDAPTDSSPDARPNVNTEMSGAAAALRRALIIIPLVGLGFSVITMSLLRIEAVLIGFHQSPAGTIETLITPLAYLAIGLWAANILTPIKRLDLEPLKWALITFAIALPVLTIYNNYKLFEHFAPDMTYFSYLAQDGGLSFMGLISQIVMALTITAICLFVAYQINETESETEHDVSAPED